MLITEAVDIIRLMVRAIAPIIIKIVMYSYVLIVLSAAAEQNHLSSCESFIHSFANLFITSFIH
jgi:type III secretory pathway component EscT